MSVHPLTSLVQSGTKLFLDSVDPELIVQNREWGATGATSNPAIMMGLIKTGRFDSTLEELADADITDAEIAWKLTDSLVKKAQDVFMDVWTKTKGNEGWVSFELDPLLEDPAANMSHADRVAEYKRLGMMWAEGHSNRMIKVPATPAGLDAIEDLCAAGISLNVTLIFTMRQYEAARDAIYRGAKRRKTLEHFKSVYSIFVSRVDQYTQQHVKDLSPEAQGMVGIVNAKRIWMANQKFWQEHATPLEQEMIFASTGTKVAGDPPWKYVEALAGSDIQTNPPETNAAVAESGRQFTRQVDKMPADSVLKEIDDKVDVSHLEKILMAEGIDKFVKPQHELEKLIADKRKQAAKS